MVNDSVATLLMFTGRAEEAMNVYTNLFPDSEILDVEKYDEGEKERAGTVKLANFRLGNQKFKFIDSPPVHEFDFTPSISIYMECENEGELKQFCDSLSDGGQVMMPVGDYGFSQLFAWVTDRFGVSWQLNLP